MFSKVFDESYKGKTFWNKETICELHREIYDLLVLGLAKDNPELLKKVIPFLEKAYIVGIKMNRKMVETKCGIKGWEEHHDKNEVIRLRGLRKSLIAELERIRDLNGN